MTTRYLSSPLNVDGNQLAIYFRPKYSRSARVLLSLLVCLGSLGKDLREMA